MDNLNEQLLNIYDMLEGVGVTEISCGCSSVARYPVVLAEENYYSVV